MNKKAIVFLLAFSFFSWLSITEAEEPSSDRFRHYMHTIFDSFVHSRTSFTLKEYDISDIHLRNMQEAVLEAKKYIPERNKDGTSLNRKLFEERINELQNTLLYLRTSVTSRDTDITKKLGEEVLDICSSCHKEVKNEYLFRLPQETIFGEYMHKISEHMDLAKIYIGENVRGETEVQIKLIDYYLGLLGGVLPERGPSGIIMDREGFNSRLKEAQTITKDLQKTLREKGVVDLEDYRKKLNTLCVACHEPERLK